MTPIQGRNVEQRMGWITLVAAAAVALYWIAYMVDAAALVGADPTVRAYESAFPVADAALALLLLAASRFLFAHRGPGAALLVAAGSAAMYLGVLDVTFYVGQDLYASWSAAALLELAVNALCLGGGALAVRVGMALWRTA